MSDSFWNVLEEAGLKVQAYRPDKRKSITLEKIGPVTLKEFCLKVEKTLGDDLFDHKKLAQCVLDPTKMAAALSEIPESSETVVYVPENLKGLTLYSDMAAKNREKRFFCSGPDGRLSKISGYHYVSSCGLKEAEAAAMAIPVIPDYLPRSPVGVIKGGVSGRETADAFNTYVRPAYFDYLENNKVPDKLPPLFKMLVNHIFLFEEEIEYFYAWLYTSLTSRCYVYLVLCGDKGIGKNRLNLVFKALHGMANSVDGKQSTLNDKFNSQLAESTLVWFDEIKYTQKSEGMMKGLQNKYVSIEKKGVDASRSTPIHCSMVISNNLPRENYISFDSRKFVPLQLTRKRLETTMTSEEIDELSRKVEDENSKDYDVAFVAQIAQWILKHGKSDKWPNLEYKGPMFYFLAHTSMNMWQRVAIAIFTHPSIHTNAGIIRDRDKGCKWSSLERFARNMARAEKRKPVYFAEASSVKSFYESFLDLKGRKGFETTDIPEDLLGDFWVKCILPDLAVADDQNETKGNDHGRNEAKEKEDFSGLDL